MTLLVGHSLASCEQRYSSKWNLCSDNLVKCSLTPRSLSNSQVHWHNWINIDSCETFPPLISLSSVTLLNSSFPVWTVGILPVSFYKSKLFNRFSTWDMLFTWYYFLTLILRVLYQLTATNSRCIRTVKNKQKTLLNALNVWPFNYVFVSILIEHF